jgi:hypothetical protein
MSLFAKVSVGPPATAPLLSESAVTPVTSASRPATTATAAVFAVRLTPASALPENVTSAWATPAARTSDVVVRRMRFGV